MKITVFGIIESPVHKFMHAADLTDHGTKIFCRIFHLSYEQKEDTEADFIKSIETAFDQSSPLRNPVFVFAFSDRGHSAVYFRQGVRSLSTNANWSLFKHVLKINELDAETDEKEIVIRIKSFEGKPIQTTLKLNK
jgi:uncharacterized lipoprotein YmbA